MSTDSSGTTPLDPARLRMARVAVSYSFFAFGLSLGVWFVHIPMVTSRLALEPAILGLVLLATGIGALVSPMVSAPLVARVGSAPATRIATLAVVLVPVALIFAPSVLALFILGPLAGICGGAINVGANTQGAEVEKAYGRPIMSSFHGFFSLGGLVAASVAGVLFSAGLGDGRAALVIAALLIVGALFLGRYYVPDSSSPSAGPGGPMFVLPDRALLTIVLVCFTCTLIEGSVGDWSALFLIRDKLATETIATTGYAMFALAMTVMRFAGGPIVSRLGDKTLVTLGGVLIIAGLSTVVLSPWVLLSAAGFLVVGLGAANISPVMTSAASRTPGMVPAVAVAMVSSAQAAGLLLGPPVIGFVAQFYGLTVALGMTAVLALVIVLGPALRPWARPAAAPA